MEWIEPVTISGEGVVLDNSPIFQTVELDDAEISLVHQFGPVDGFTILLVSGYFLFQELGGHSQRHDAIAAYAVRAPEC